MTRASEWANAPASAEARRDVVDLIARHVRPRFALSLEAFADRVAEVARGAFPDDPWPACAARLSLDDLYLATACARGEDAAWRECEARHFGFIRDFARRRLPATLADEVAGDVIADLWRRGTIARFQGRSRLQTWMGTVVAHAAVNAAKRARVRGVAADVPRSSRDGRAGEDDVETKSMRSRAAELLSRLLPEAVAARSDDERLLLLLYYEQGLTLDQVAAVVSGTSKSSLSRRLSRLRQELRAALEAHAATEGLSAEELRSGIDLARLDLELGSMLANRSRAGEDDRPVSKPVKGGPP